MAFIQSEKDKAIIDEHLEYSDFSVFFRSEQTIREFEYYLSGKNWDLIADQQHGKKCFFCDNPAKYDNFALEMFACSGCYFEINDGEIDLIDPGNHLISKKIQQQLREIIDMVYCCSDGDDCSITIFENRTCFICSQNIVEGEFMMTEVNNKYAIAHEKCHGQHGFRGFFNDEDYKSIIEDIEEDILRDLESNRSYHIQKRVDPCRLIRVTNLGDQNKLDRLFFRHEFYQEGCVQAFFNQCKISLQNHLPIIREIYVTLNPPIPPGSWNMACIEIIEYLNTILPPKWLRINIKKLIDENLWISFPRNKLFVEEKITHTTCAFCCKTLLNNDEDEICISGNNRNWAMAHWECGEHGFSGLFNEDDYDDKIYNIEREFVRFLLL
jgi:hypothetical protein